MSRLNHLRYRRYLDAHLDGELTGTRAARVAGHVAECAQCRPAAELTVKVKDRLARRRLPCQRAAERVRLWIRRAIS